MGVGGQRHAPATLTRVGDLVPIVQKMGRAQGPVWTSAEKLVPPRFDPRTVHTTICLPTLAYLLVIVKNTKSFLKVIISFFNADVCHLIIKVSADLPCVGGYDTVQGRDP